MCKILYFNIDICPCKVFFKFTTSENSRRLLPTFLTKMIWLSDNFD